MEAIFSQVLNMSLTASVVIVFVLIARLALKKAPKIYSYALWSVVLFRLLCPVSLQSPVSVLEVASPQVTRTEGIASSVSYIPAANIDPEPMTEIQPALSVQPQVESPKPAIATVTIVTWTWLAGVAIMLLRSTVSYLQLRHRMIGAIPFRGNVYLADHIPTPFVLGLFQPKIYLPSGTPSRERLYIISHERHHIRRGDHIIKWLAYGALSIHWFNPLVWVAFVQAGKDMEMSCDEAVIKKLGSQIRADYSASLLRLATGQRIIAGTPLAFGEGDTKGRIRNMAKWKKPKLWVSAVCLLLCVAILIACGMNPEGASGAEVVLDDFHVNLPNYYTAEATGDVSVIFIKGEETVGGLVKRTSPFQLKFGGESDPEEWNTFEWLEALGIPEVHDWTFSVSNSDDKIGARNRDDLLVVDCHPVNAESFGRYHFLWFGEGDDVYDLWFDKTMIEEKAIEDIVDTVSVNEIGKGKTVYGECVLTEGSEELTQDSYTAYLQEAYGLTSLEDHTVFHHNGWVQLDFQFSEDAPQWQIDAAKTFAVNKFYWRDIAKYDLWDYDVWLIEHSEAEIKGVSYRIFVEDKLAVDGAYPETEAGVNTAEELAFEQVKAVFDTVQSGAYQIQVQQENEGNEGPKAYLTTYFDDGENWLRLHEVLPEGTNQTEAGDYYNRMAHLSHKGFHYSNDGHWNERGAIQWTAIGQKDLEAVRQSRTSMLASFQWRKESVAYMDTLTDETGECLMFRVDKKYADQEDYTDHYFANFYFDPDGKFRNVRFQVNLYQDNAFTATESIVSLDQAAIAEQIDSYYKYGIPVPATTGKPVISGADIVTNVELVQYGVMTMTLPDGYTCREESGSIVLIQAGTDVGGITCWATPKEELILPGYNIGGTMSEWVQALGLPEAQETEEPIGYFISNSQYGDLVAEFFNELDLEKLNVAHEFFVVGDLVYDVYYNQNIISGTQAEKFLKTIAISGEPVVPPEPSAEDALAKCKAVLDMVQSGSHCLAAEQKNTGSMALNDYASNRYWQHDGNWLSSTEIPESGGSSYFYYMEVDGVHYNTERTGWDESGPIWAEQRAVEVGKPWLAVFQWDPDIVTYETTLINGGEESIMLRIDQPYPYGENNTECYYVSFKFVTGGAFLNAYIQVNPLRDNRFTRTESIVTLDAAAVAAEIEKEHLRAIN